MIIPRPARAIGEMKGKPLPLPIGNIVRRQHCVFM